MPAAQRGTATRSNSAAANTTYTATQPQTPLAGSKQIMVVIARRTTTAAAVTTPAGWTECGRTTTAVVGGDQGLLIMFYRDCTGSETSPSIAYTGSSSSAIIEEWTGLQTGVDGSAGVANTAAATSGSVTLTGNLTTTNADDLIFAVGGTTNLAATTFTWGGGQTADVAYSNVASVGLGTSTQVVSSAGAKAPSLTYNRTSGTGMVVAQAFKVASGQNQYAGIMPI